MGYLAPGLSPMRHVCKQPTPYLNQTESHDDTHTHTHSHARPPARHARTHARARTLTRALARTYARSHARTHLPKRLWPCVQQPKPNGSETRRSDPSRAHSPAPSSWLEFEADGRGNPRPMADDLHPEDSVKQNKKQVPEFQSTWRHRKPA